MEPFEKFVHRVFFGSLAFVLLPAGILILAGLDILARGFVLGGAASLVNLLLMAFNLKRQTGSPGRRRAVISTGSYILRMGVITAALIYAAADDNISLIAAIPSLFSVQVVLLVGGLTGLLEGQD